MGSTTPDSIDRILADMKSQVGGVAAIVDLQKLLVCKKWFTEASAQAILGNLESIPLLQRWHLIEQKEGYYFLDPFMAIVLTPDPSAYPSHYDFYYALAQHHDDTRYYAGLTPDHSQLAIAFEWAISAGDYEKAYQLCKILCHNFPNCSQWQLKQSFLEQLAQVLESYPPSDIKASVQHELGVFYGQLDFPLEDRVHNMKRAVGCHEIALQYWTPAVYPLDYAKVQHSLGENRLRLASFEDRSENLQQAIGYYKSALVYLTPQLAPREYATSQTHLGWVYYWLAKLENSDDYFRQAMTCYQATVGYWASQAALGEYVDMLEYSYLQHTLGMIYKALGDRGSAIKAWREAEKYYRQMRDIEKADLMLQWIRDADQQQ